MATGAVGKQIQLLFFNAVFHIAALAIQIIVQGLRIARQIGTFVDGSSSITTSDMEIAAPISTPGFFILNANMEVVSGTGIYEGVHGRLAAHGTIDFRALPTAEFEIEGAISATEVTE